MYWYFHCSSSWNTDEPEIIELNPRGRLCHSPVSEMKHVELEGLCIVSCNKARLSKHRPVGCTVPQDPELSYHQPLIWLPRGPAVPCSSALFFYYPLWANAYLCITHSVTKVFSSLHRTNWMFRVLKSRPAASAWIWLCLLSGSIFLSKKGGGEEGLDDLKSNFYL